MNKKILFLNLGLVIITSSLFSWFLKDSTLDISKALEAPSWAHWFGRDSLGRDLMTRALRGLSISLAIGFGSTCLSIFLGFLIGGHSGFKGGKFDFILMRILDVLEGIPNFLMAVALCLPIFFIQVENSFLVFLILTSSIGVALAPAAIRQIRNLFLREANQSYVESAFSVGASSYQIIFRHIFPNIKNEIANLALIKVVAAIGLEATLTIFGFGMKSPFESWGVLVLEGWRLQSAAAFIVWLPSLPLIIIILALNQLKFR